MELIEIKKQRLKLYLEAEEKILLGQSYSLDNRTLSRPNLAEVRAEISRLIEEIALLEGAKNGRTRRVVFVD